MAENENENIEILTEEEVWDIVSFARAVSGIYPSMAYLSPELISSRMKDITLNPMQATQNDLDDAMKSPKDNEERLRSFSQDFELRSMVYKRLNSYLSNLLAFDITYTSDAELKHYSTPRYIDDLKTITTFLDKFDFKKEFNVVVRQLIKNDAYFGVFRKVGEGYVLQELPPDYCKITGKWENGYLFSFDMNWFMQPGVNIDMYPKFFKEKYIDYFNNNKQKGYNPAINLGMRGMSTWVEWVDIPVDIGVCFKLSPEIATRLPYFTPLFNDLVLQGLMRTLQKNVNMANASRMIVGQVPMYTGDKKASVRDAIAISPDLLGKFMALVKSAISEAINVASAPLEDMQAIEFDKNNDMYDSYLRTTLASSGINTNLIFSSDIKPNAIETQLSLDVDEQMMESIYPQFNSFMNYHANKLTTHFKFMFEFEGSNFHTNRKNRFQNSLDLFDRGIILPQKIAASLGMRPSVFYKHMLEAEAMDFMGKLTPPQVEAQKEIIETQGEQLQTPSTPNVATTPSKKRGRPKKDLDELGEEGVKTRETGQNVAKGGES